MNEMPIVDRLERLMYDLRLEYQEYIELREIRYEVERLQNENATLKERLEKTLELPFFQKDGEVIVVIYKDKGGIVCVEKYLEDEFYEEMSGLEAAKDRLAELKGEKYENSCRKARKYSK